jgi:lipopolysaccharide export LptBFGC system permease protein LptF
VIRTLHGYITGDLLKVLLQALVPFTLVMTVFAILEPLRRQGLAASQVLGLFVFTVPATISLTLPVAALFAATFVYGRFAQDNELLACRAGGIPTLTLLRPALGLGLGVTLLTLVLSNFVTPQLARMAAHAAEANLRGIIYHKIQSEGYFKRGTWLLHADEVDPKTDKLFGVVGADLDPDGRSRLLAASYADVHFRSYGGRTYVTIQLENAAQTETGGQNVVHLGEVYFESPPLPNIIGQMEEKPESYSWPELLEMRDDPSDHGRIRQGLADIRRDILHNNAVRLIAGEINQGNEYSLQGIDQRYVVSAQAAQVVGRNKVELLSGVSTEGQPIPVRVRVYRDKVMRQIITADAGSIQATWSRMQDKSYLNIALSGNITVEFLSLAEDRVQRRSDWRIGRLAIPETIVDQARGISLRDVYTNAEQYTRDKGILKSVDQLITQGVDRILSEIQAELHGRAAYGISCFLMVAMGAGLGLMFKGGQLISAVALAAIPGSVVTLMILMGKELVTNPDVPEPIGIGSIWAGVVLLLAANTVLYLRHSRQ